MIINLWFFSESTYEVEAYTNIAPNAQTSNYIYITLHGTKGSSPRMLLDNPNINDFESGK